MEKKKNQGARRQVVRTVQNVSLALMVCVVIGLTAAVIALLALNVALDGEDTFDMEQFTEPHRDTEAILGEHLLPSFIGIRAKGEQKGISAGYNAVYDIYSVFTPVLRDVLTEGFRKVSSDRFEEAVGSGTFVYLRYHSPLPWQAIYACAGGENESYGMSASVYELVILPDQGFRIYTRTIGGDVYQFEGTYKSYFTSESLSNLLSSYQRSMVDFVFAEGGEPQFTDRIRTKNMLVSEKTAALIQNRESHIAAILRLMSFNPDKLYTHEESDIGFVYVENHGVLRLLDESVEYASASAEGGIPVEAFASRYGKNGDTLGCYLETACVIVDQLKALSAHYAGGDAEILLESVRTEDNGTTTLRFIYTFDNLRLSGCEWALTVSFFRGKLVNMRLYSVSARNLGVQEDSFLEQWYANTAAANCPDGWRIVDIAPVYRTDFYSDSISAEWSAVYGTRPDDGLHNEVTDRAVK